MLFSSSRQGKANNPKPTPSKILKIISPTIAMRRSGSTPTNQKIANKNLVITSQQSILEQQQ
jgi:hypothetical protein